ncbi:unnamed protein product [Prorocentrum cordatum]|uniref:Beta-lactamase-related domain-containing protein n=1 Tax=Prorocentrum cordatum TaxID=2364126 RepID=A0ABN9S5Y1_9DINO|nr:unnamed protein product [Polarella glacialis]
MALRVDVPASTVRLFVERPGGGAHPRAPLREVAQALGYAGLGELRAELGSWWSSWGCSGSVSAAELVALVHLLQFKSGAARALAGDLAAGGATRVVSLPSEPLHPPGEDAPAAADGASVASSTSPAKGPRRAERSDPKAAEREAPWPRCEPEDVGMDREALEKCKRYLEYRVKRNHFAGIVGGVVKNGKLVYFEKMGFADVEKKVPMQQDTIMRLFSMTKCIVAVAFLTFAEDPANGILLDDPVWKYIPAFRQTKLAPQRGSVKPRDLETAWFTVKKDNGKVVRQKLPTVPTLRQLLTHTAGLGYGPTLGDPTPPGKNDHYRIYYDLIERVNREQVASLEEFVNELAKVPLKVHPGKYWEYSFATDVLGRVLEVISGKPLDEVLEERVCGPLGMSDTCFRVPPEKAHRVGAWYQRKSPEGNPGEKKPGAAFTLERLDGSGANSGWVGSRVSKVLSAGGTIETPLSIKGGMVSTFRDYLRFLLMIRGMGSLDGVQILRRETVQMMITNQIPAATGRRAAWVFDKKGQGYNMLGQIQVQTLEKVSSSTYASLMPGTVSAEFGWGGLGGPAWTIDPRLDLIVLSMTQTASELDHEENLRFSARRSIHAGIFGPTAGPVKVTDFPPEGHEGIKGGKLRPPKAIKGQEGTKGITVTKPSDDELSTFAEAEKEAMLRPKSLKELAISRGNVGHEDDEGEASGGAAGAGGDADAALVAEAGSPEARPRGAERAARAPAKTPARAQAAGAEGAAEEAAPAAAAAGAAAKRRPEERGEEARGGKRPRPAAGEGEAEPAEEVVEGMTYESLRQDAEREGKEHYFFDESQYSRPSAARIERDLPKDFGHFMNTKGADTKPRTM